MVTLIAVPGCEVTAVSPVAGPFRRNLRKLRLTRSVWTIAAMRFKLFVSEP
jgi:hypothetical protein